MRTSGRRERTNVHSVRDEPLAGLDEGPLALSVDQLSARTSFGRTFIYSEIKAGRLRLTKKGRRSIVLLEDALRWLHGDEASQ
jgi:hypothetical protein